MDDSERSHLGIVGPCLQTSIVPAVAREEVLCGGSYPAQSQVGKPYAVATGPDSEDNKPTATRVRVGGGPEGQVLVEERKGADIAWGSGVLLLEDRKDAVSDGSSAYQF